MKKLSVYALAATAALTVAGIAPGTAHAAMSTYNIPGGKMVVIGGNQAGDLNQILGQIHNGIQFSGLGLGQAGFPGNGFPGVDCPSPDAPNQNIPGYPSPDAPNQNIPGKPSQDQDAFVEQVVNLVNRERAGAGLQPLAVNRSVAGAARTRAGEIENSFSHTRPNGSDFNTVLNEAGVGYRSAGENIAYGQRTPEEVMQGWMNSAGHRANILNGNFTSIGVGHYRSQSGVDYWAQLFIN